MNSETKYIAASLILIQLPKGRAIDDQTLMLEASAQAGDDFDAMEADELRRRIEALPEDLKIIDQTPLGAAEFVKNDIRYFVWRPR